MTKVQLRVDEILAERGKSAYWFGLEMGMCYRNYMNILTNQVTSIHFDTLARMCEVLEVPVAELFEEIKIENE